VNLSICEGYDIPSHKNGVNLSIHLTLHKYLGSLHSFDWVHLTLHKYVGSPHSYDLVHLTLHKFLGSHHSYDWVHLTIRSEPKYL
jgi:hypothetical protein